MMRDSLVLLKYECTRRPDLAALAANVEHLSDDEIKAAGVAAPWMRDALLRLKAKRLYDCWAATVDLWAQVGQVGDPPGVTRRWQGGETYVRVGRTELLMRFGQLIWLDRNGIWIDTIHTTHIDPKLHAHTVFHGRMTRSEYNDAVREQARTLRTPTDDSPTEKQMFRIFRPV